MAWPSKPRRNRRNRALVPVRQTLLSNDAVLVEATRLSTDTISYVFSNPIGIKPNNPPVFLAGAFSLPGIASEGISQVDPVGFQWSVTYEANVPAGSYTLTANENLVSLAGGLYCGGPFTVEA